MQTPLQILLVFEEGLGESFAAGLYCLKDILPKYAYSHSKIGCVFYGTDIRLIELREGGRIIKLNEDTFELMNDHFYSIEDEQLETLGEYLDGIR